MENKFLEAIKQLVTYGNREFLRSFRLRTEIKEEHNNNKETTTTDIASLSLSLVPPFQTIGFLERKWLEMIKELVDYGNKNILGNFKLYLVIEEKSEEETKEITNGILDIKQEDKRTEVPNPNNHNQNSNNNSNNHNQSWFRARDKSGRFISISTKL
jgi:hypothetical protein